MKKVVSILLAGLFTVCLLASCNDGSENLSSALVSSETAQTEEVSSKDNESEKVSSKPKENSSTVTTTSAPAADKTSSNNKPLFGRNSSSQSESQSIKYYNKGTIGLGSHEFRLDLCTAAGDDYKSKLEEFSDVVNEGYFNTYFVSLDETILDQMKVIAESGGTVWISGTRSVTETNIDSIIDDIKFYLDLLDDHGYKDLVNGVYWYEPLWEGAITNSEFLKITKAIYQKLGLRNFPTFAPHNFVGATGNETEEQADKDNIILPSSLKYVTDISFTSYGYDVRGGVKISDSKLESLHNTISPEIKTTEDYYTCLQEKLHNYTGHPVNTWYYACAYDVSVAVGLDGLRKADEDYCIAHLEFMSNDVLKSEYQGGIIIHKYYIKNGGTGFQRHLPLKDARGKYKYYSSDEKWDNYGRTLKKVKEKFDSQKANTAKIK